MDENFRTTFDRLISEYEKQLPAYQAFAAFLREVLAKAAGKLIPYAVVEARAKDMASFAEKVVRKGKKYQTIPGYDMTDRCGVRVIVQTLDEMELMCRYIKNHFDIDWANSVDKKTDLKDDQFGYLGMHYIVRIKENVKTMEDIAVPANVTTGPEGFNAEVQVKTLLQHAWANPLHDRLYKVPLKPSSPTKREAAGVMAAIEAADSRITQVAGHVDSFLGHYAAYLSPQALDEEIEVARAVVEVEQKGLAKLKARAKGKPLNEQQQKERRAKEAGLGKVALKLGRLLMLRNGQAQPALTAKKRSKGTPAQPCDRDAAIELWRQVKDLKCPVRDAIRMELGDALCRLHRDNPNHRDYARGQALLREVASHTLAQGEVEHPHAVYTRARAASLLAWSMTNVDVLSEEAYGWFRRAHEIQPDDPYYLTDYLAAEAVQGDGPGFAVIMRQQIMRAMDVCRSHIEVGIEQPRAQFTIARLQALLGEADPTLDAYLQGVALLMNKQSYTPAEVLQDELMFLRRIHRKPKGVPEGFVYVWRVLELALAAKREQKGQAFALSDQMSQEAKEGRLGEFKRCLLIAGGAGWITCKLDVPMDSDKSITYRKIITEALSHADGLVLSGGSTEGVPGAVGEAAHSLPTELRKRFKLVGYLPNIRDTRMPVDERYDVLIKTSGTEKDFSYLEPIQGWIDVLGTSMSPEQVRVLGIEGGRIAAMEYRLALALGAVVAVIPDSGRAADDLLQDPVWSKMPNLIRLTPDLAVDMGTMRAFVRPAFLDIAPEQLDEIAEIVHKDYLKLNPTSDIDPTKKPYKQLREDLKESNRQQVLYAAEILASQGFMLTPAQGPDPFATDPFCDSQRRKMAELEHGRWNVERLLSGWTYGLKKNPEARVNPCIVPWDKLPEHIQGYDLDAISHYARNLAAAGYRIAHPDKDSPVPLSMSVKAVIHDQQGRILAIQRSAKSSHDAGKWDLPGGKVDPGESLTTALVREVREETGLCIHLTHLAGSTQSETPSRIVVYLIMAARIAEGELHLSDEHINSRWVTLKEFRTLDICHQFKAFAASYQP